MLEKVSGSGDEAEAQNKEALSKLERIEGNLHCVPDEQFCPAVQIGFDTIDDEIKKRIMKHYKVYGNPQ